MLQISGSLLNTIINPGSLEEIWCIIMLLKVICLQYSHSNTAWKTFVSCSEAAPGSSHISDNLPAFAKAVQQEELKQEEQQGPLNRLP